MKSIERKLREEAKELQKIAEKAKRDCCMRRREDFGLLRSAESRSIIINPERLAAQKPKAKTEDT